ncbi:MAG: hypothetical protein ABJE95_01685 [Byssovorax sp.]
MHTPLRLWILALAITAAGCGARSSVPEPASDAGASTASTSTGSDAQRSCPPECTVGHECCLGSCDGPAVQIPSDCCSCLDGEISSFDCGGHCGGIP